MEPAPSPAAPHATHRLLRRQLRHIFGAEIAAEGDWGALLQAVDDAYHDADCERRLLETALEVSAQELTEANNKLRLFIDNAPAGIVMFDRELRYLFASRRWLQERQVKLHDVVGRNYREIRLTTTDRWEEILLRCVAEDTGRCDDEALPLPDGGTCWMRREIHPWHDADGVVGGIIVMIEDITDRKRAEEQMRIAAVAFQSRDGMIVTDAEGTIMQVNQAFTDVTGYTAEDAIGKRVALLHSGRQDATFYRNMWEAIAHEGRWEGEIWNRRKDGGIFPGWLTISGIGDAGGKITHYLGTYADISEPREATRKLLELAFYDPLTALPNRRLLLDRLHKAIAASARSGQFGAVLLIDLDHFKTLNDTRGHDIGDELLIHVARRLRELIRGADSAARLGGDEFVVLLEGLNEEQLTAANVAETIAAKLSIAISRPVILKGEIHHVTPSIGVTLFHHATQDAEALLKQADLALYQAKDAGRNAVRFYNPAMQAAVEARVRLEAGLRRALTADEFVLHYQPQVDAAGRLIGAEALLRWRPPGQPMILPADFIPVAEDSGLIVPIGRWVLDTACRQLAAWSDAPETRDLQLAVNISARQFRQPDFVEHVRMAVRSSGANPARLKLELTERYVLEDIEHVVRTMQMLKQDGVGFSIDDFGTGYSSLAYLKRLALDQLKIDQSFVRDIADDADDRAIVHAIISLAESLGLQVIAEGVETAAQFDFLAAHNCQGYQGYLFGRPGPVEQMDTRPRGGTGSSACPGAAFDGRADGKP
ncbi:bifunctional diguanylate cyclase/phosphodiesterase [Azoarcus sp. KH32C]|uniref:putative bifunctional diguanylate cyclase/phosphodiesterase n=1 Tax=Azoarcus sp. KH32C TaxID=748247 RepID=UPI0002386F18|nr:bifunctional diguanylate cyclase/phosphodiesterase [Azoarcus sp. KH32C]BAL25544.1 diguanylate cyclase/phosphodiesterase with PAS/PAC sensor [Azoarcus sp. KH32C]